MSEYRSPTSIPGQKSSIIVVNSSVVSFKVTPSVYSEVGGKDSLKRAKIASNSVCDMAENLKNPGSCRTPFHLTAICCVKASPLLYQG